MIRSLGPRLLTIAVIVSVIPCISNAQSVLTQHVRAVTLTGEAAPVSRLPATDTLSLDLVLPLSDPEGLKTFLAELYDPNSSTYHHFLTPTEFTAKFGPTEEQYAEVLNFAKTNGLTVTGGSRDGMEVQISGSVLAIEHAMHVNMLTYQHSFDSAARVMTTIDSMLDTLINKTGLVGIA